MNESNMNNFSETNWELIDNLTDDTIDRSDLPPLDDAFFQRATWRLPMESTPKKRVPPKRIPVTVEVDAELLAWFRASGDDYRQRMLAALHIYAAAHRAARPV